MTSDLPLSLRSRLRRRRRLGNMSSILLNTFTKQADPLTVKREMSFSTSNLLGLVGQQQLSLQGTVEERRLC